MASRLYSVYNGPMVTTAAPVKVTTSTSIKTLLQVATASTLSLEVIEWGISFDGSAAATPGVVELVAAVEEPLDDPTTLLVPLLEVLLGRSNFREPGSRFQRRCRVFLLGGLFGVVRHFNPSESCASQALSGSSTPHPL